MNLTIDAATDVAVPVPSVRPRPVSRGIALAKALPPVCFLRLRARPATVEIRAGRLGYLPIDSAVHPMDLNPVDITPAQVVAMRFGSVYGWDIETADPGFWERRWRLFDNAPTLREAVEGHAYAATPRSRG
jgi:hypothetical protein